MFMCQMAQQDELKVQTKINRRYQIFDQSGSPPFRIVFSLCCRSPQDTDAWPFILETSASIVDVPYTLANGLLKMPGGQEETKLT